MAKRSSELGSYLRARRALVQPEDVGLTREPGRRVPGLRRDELARLAGISADYYLRLEQGRDRNPSDQVSIALARALRLDDVATRYLLRLARDTVPVDADGRPSDAADGADLVRRLSSTPVFVTDPSFDVVQASAVADRLGRGSISKGANRLLEVFDARFPRDDGWMLEATETIGAMRLRGDPDDPRFQDVVGRLAISDATFRRLWARQDVHVFTGGRLHLRVEGGSAVAFDRLDLELPWRSGLWLTLLSGEPGSAAARMIAAAQRPAEHGTLVDRESA